MNENTVATSLKTGNKRSPKKNNSLRTQFRKSLYNNQEPKANYNLKTHNQL